MLDDAKKQGEVRIKLADGEEFILRPVSRSPLDVGSVKLDPPITAEEIVQFVREGRKRGYPNPTRHPPAPIKKH